MTGAAVAAAGSQNPALAVGVPMLRTLFSAVLAWQ